MKILSGIALFVLFICAIHNFILGIVGHDVYYLVLSIIEFRVSKCLMWWLND